MTRLEHLHSALGPNGIVDQLALTYRKVRLSGCLHHTHEGAVHIHISFGRDTRTYTHVSPLLFIPLTLCLDPYGSPRGKHPIEGMLSILIASS